MQNEKFAKKAFMTSIKYYHTTTKLACQFLHILVNILLLFHSSQIETENFFLNDNIQAFIFPYSK
ncbi:MAG TPA: hypothetical protein DEP42_07620 [Ruminococcaceae bacterium]|nr:hypothetical protein [Oscillospiraceae bacterium]